MGEDACNTKQPKEASSTLSHNLNAIKETGNLAAAWWFWRTSEHSPPSGKAQGEIQ